MNHCSNDHQRFFNGLTAKQQYYFNLYKGNDNSFAYNLNNTLRLGDQINYREEIKIMDSIFNSFESSFDMVLYRATVDANVSPFIIGNIYNNPEYLSTGSDLDSVQTHFTDSNRPVLLEICCKKGMNMAPLEGNTLYSGEENEYLLGRNNRFLVEAAEEITEKKRIEEIMGGLYAQGVSLLVKYQLTYIG